MHTQQYFSKSLAISKGQFTPTTTVADTRVELGRVGVVGVNCHNDRFISLI